MSEVENMRRRRSMCDDIMCDDIMCDDIMCDDIMCDDIDIFFTHNLY